MVINFKVVFVCLILFTTTLLSYAAEEKPTIAVYVLHSDSDPANRLANSKISVLIGESLEQGLMETKRYQVIERELFKTVKKEREVQKSEDYIFAQQLAEQGVSIGSDFILIADVSALNIQQETNYKNTLIRISVMYNLELLDVRKRQSLESFPFQITTTGYLSEGGMGTFTKNLNDIYIKFQDKIKTDCKQLLFNALPLDGITIVEITETNKKGNEAQRVLINAGESDGLYSQWLNRFQLQVIESFEEEFEGVKYKRDKIISDLSVMSIAGEHLSVCKVKSNEKELFEKVNNKSKLYIRYKKKSLDNTLN